MKSFVLIILSTLLVTVSGIGCKSRKAKLDCAQALTSYPKEVLTEVSENLASFEFLSMRAKANYTQGQNSNSFGMNIKMQKDSFVWVSIVAVIELARAYITPDTFVLLDRFNKKYYKGAIQDLEKFTGQNLSLSQLQNLLISNPIYGITLFEKNNDELRKDHLKYESDGIVNRVELSGCYRSISSEFTTTTDSKKVVVDYQNFSKEKDLGYVGNQININANGAGKSFNFLMEYTSISTAEFDPIVFIIPSRYEKGN
ncbi:MAG: DUF4292 domain-containing protein [Bacteroidetes bacterium]|jgi:hypothetical protein|nr:DUF4292 domain-containing protein [Bacteroidota bacterium]